MPHGEQLLRFIIQAVRRNIAQQLGNFRRKDVQNFFINAEIQLGGEAQRAQHAHRIFFKALQRIAQQAQGFMLNVINRIAEIQHFVFARLIIQRVDGEIAARKVLLNAAPVVVAQNHAGSRGHFFLRRRAERRHLNQFAA